MEEVESDNKNENIKIKQLVKKLNKISKENDSLIEENKELKNEIKKLKLKIKDNEELNINPIKLYKTPTLIGLNNIGATCFMNATLQCLSQTKSLTKYFLDQNNKERIEYNNVFLMNSEDYQLSPIYLELIQKLWDKKNNKPYSPTNFMNTINNMNPLFKRGEPGDSKDFIIFILEQFHKELKKSILSNNDNNTKINQPINQYDKINSFNHFFSEFKKECSIISDIFFGILETTNECINCKNYYNSQGMNNLICYNYQIFNCLIFPLEEVKKMKNNLMMNNNMYQTNNNVVNLYDCFSYNQKTDLFTGPNQNYCNICKKLNDSNYTSKIYIGPNVLILILNRGKNNIYNIKLDFNQTIDLTQFILQKDMPLIIYSLYGVITHIGQSGPNAHFVASCKSPIDHKWYRYNDSIVTPIKDIQKEVIDFGTPYILFYYKIKLE